MPRAEAGSSKAIGNAIKAKGLTKLRFYCQVCEKACRDENGYKCHIESESHMRQIAALGSNPNKVIDGFSKEFQNGFVSLLSRRFGTAKVNANKVYQEYIQERHHLHMNATKWVTLSEFVKHLGREGIVKVEEITDEGQHGWYLTWIDNSPTALARQAALQKMSRSKVDEEGRARKLLKEQIERAKKQEEEVVGANGSHKDFHLQAELKGDGERQPVRIGISLGAPKRSSDQSIKSNDEKDEKKTDVPQQSDPGTSFSAAPLKISTNPFKAMKKPGAVQKDKPKLGSGSLKSSSSSSQQQSPKPSSGPSNMTAAERIMAEEKALSEKRKLMGPQPSAKRMKM